MFANHCNAIVAAGDDIGLTTLKITGAGISQRNQGSGAGNVCGSNLVSENVHCLLKIKNKSSRRAS